MNDLTYTSGKQTLVRIQKARARKLFLMGERVYIQACNLSPFDKNQEGFRLDPAKGFDKQVKEFEHWYCTSKLVGYRPSFYTTAGNN